MDGMLPGRFLTKIAVVILAVAVVDLAYLNLWIIKNKQSFSSNKKVEVERTEIEQQLGQERFIAIEPSPAPSKQAEVESTESSAKETIVETKTIVEKETETIIQTAQKEIFIPMGTGSTKSNTFVDLTGVEVTIDTTKYPEIDSFVFEASIWPDGGNGRAYAQLKNVTDSNPLIESQISNALAEPTLKTSGKIPYANGVKNYRAQAKTDITDWAAHVDGARIKITLK
jgi:hypothetical protein